RVLQGVGVLALAVATERGVSVEEGLHQALRDRLRDARGGCGIAVRGECLVPLHRNVSRDIARSFEFIAAARLRLALGLRLGFWLRLRLNRLSGRRLRAEVAGLFCG